MFGGILGLGCSGSDRVPQTVTPDGDAGFWAAGAKGYAAFIDRGGRVERRDYPMRRNAPKWAYDRWTGAAAQVVMVQQQAVLVTRIGEFFDWTHGAWRRLPVQIPEYYGDAPQLEHLFMTPGGQLGLHFHHGALMLGTMGELLSGRHQLETLDGYLTWTGVAGSAIYGLGWDQEGYTQAMYRRESSGPWTLVTRLLWDPLCVLSDADGRPLVVTQRAMVDPAPRSRGSLSSPVPLVGSDTTVSELAALVNIHVSRCISEDGGRDALLLTSMADGFDVVTVHEGQLAAWSCPGWSAWETIDAMIYRGQWTMVTEELSLVVVPRQCDAVEAKAALVEATSGT